MFSGDQITDKFKFTVLSVERILGNFDEQNRDFCFLFSIHLQNVHPFWVHLPSEERVEHKIPVTIATGRTPRFL